MNSTWDFYCPTYYDNEKQPKLIDHSYTVLDYMSDCIEFLECANSYSHTHISCPFFPSKVSKDSCTNDTNRVQVRFSPVSVYLCILCLPAVLLLALVVVFLWSEVCVNFLVCFPHPHLHPP